MKISYVLPAYWPAIGGCELHTHELVGRLSERHDIKVITQITSQEDKPDDLWMGTLTRPARRKERYCDRKAQVIPIELTAGERCLLRPFARYHHRAPKISMGVIQRVFLPKILAHVRDSSVVHCVHNGASFYACAALACARKLGIPFVFTPLLQINQALRDKAPQQDEWRNGQSAVVPGSIGSYLVPGSYHDQFWLNAARAADALISMTSFEKEFLVGEGIPPARIHEVGVGPLLSGTHDGTAFRNARGIGNEDMVLFLGRKHPAKGLEEVLAATARVWEKKPGVRFVFVGPKEGNAAEIFRRYEDPRIVEIDRVELEEKTSAIEACDIFCMPSFFEALGGVFLEAWSFEKPVIAGNTSALRELTENGRGGFLVNLDPSDIAEKIIRLLDDPDLRRRMGAWGRQKVESQYSWDAIAAKVENVYRQLV
jgi:glycosyltransferase involved in cell wall biosynthesis